MIAIGLFVFLYIFFGVIAGKTLFILIRDKGLFGEGYIYETNIIEVSIICGMFFPISIPIILIVKIAIKLADKIIKKF